MNLRVSPTPGLFETRETRAGAAAFYLKRKPYRIKAFGGARADDGSIKAYCAASTLAKSSIKCANKPESKTGRVDRIEIGTALPIIGTVPLPSICAQSTVRIPFDEMPFWQPYIPGTPEHQWSINRRNTVETNFSRIKDEATQSMRRGQVRLMGTAKMSIATVFFAMASNIVEVERWRLRRAGVYCLDAAREIKVRIPRRHTRARLAAIAERDARREAKALREQLALDGVVVDLATGEITQLKDDPPPA